MLPVLLDENHPSSVIVAVFGQLSKKVACELADARGRGAKIVHGKAIAFSLLARQQKFHENLVWLPAVKKTKNKQDKAMEAEPKAKKQRSG